MGHIPQRSLENLKKYAYKGVDKWVLLHHSMFPTYCNCYLGHWFHVMSWTHFGPGLLPYGLSLWPPTRSVQSVWYCSNSGTHLKHLFRSLWLAWALCLLISSRYFTMTLYIWRNMKARRAHRTGYTTRKMASSRPQLLLILSEIRWAAGLFAYQSLDAIDG